MNLSQNIRFVILILLLILLLKFPFYNLDYNWDEMVYVAQAKYYSIFGPFSIPPGDVGSIPLFLWALALAYVLFGEAPLITHLATTIIGFFGVFFTYLMGKVLFNERIGAMAAFLLLFSSAYFAESGQATRDLALVALTVITLYYGVQGKLRPYLLTGSLLVLTKEPGALVVLAIIVYSILKKERPQIIFAYSIPLLFIFGWELWYLTETGNLGPTARGGIASRVFAQSLIGILGKGFTNLYRVFIADFKILPALLIGAALYKKYRSQKFQFSFNEHFLVVSFVALYLTSFSILPTLARRMLPVYPFFFIYSAAAIDFVLPKRRGLLITALMLGLFTSAWFGSSSPFAIIQDPLFLNNQMSGETNLEYVDRVKLETEAIRYIFENYPNSRVFTQFPIASQASIAVNVGYRQWDKHNITVHTIPLEVLNPYDPTKPDRGDIDLQPYLEMLEENDLVIFEHVENRNKFNEIAAKITGKEITVYQPPQLWPPEIVTKVQTMQLVKRFDGDDFFIEIYENPKGFK